MIWDLIWEWFPPTAAGLLSALLGFVELAAGRRKPLSVRAWHWILGRLTIDGFTGAVSYGILNSALQGLDWFEGPIPVVVAALAGPAVLRSRLSLISVGTGDRTIGINAHARLLRLIDDQIDDIGAEAQARWRRETAQALAVLPLAEIAERADAYLRNLDRLRKTYQDEHEWLEATVAEDSTPEETRRDAIIQRLLDIGGRRFLERLARECRQVQRPGPEPPPLPQHPVPELERKNHASRP